MSQADFFIKTVWGYPENIRPLCVDVEPVYLPQVELTKKQYADLLSDFIDRFRDIMGEYPIIYTGVGSWSRLMGLEDRPNFRLCGLWVAHYTEANEPLLPPPWKNVGWELWQFSSSKYVPGISADPTDGVDINRLPDMVVEPPMPTGDFKLVNFPTKTGQVSQVFGGNTTGDNDFYTEWGLPGHDGIDYKAKKGDPIFATADGVITLIAKPGSGGIVANHAYGKHIKISHHNGDFTTQYCHLNDFAPLIKVNQLVRAGDIIGYAGNTGNVVAGPGSDGTHLHFMLRKKGATAANEKQLLVNGTWATYPGDIVNPQNYYADKLT